MNRKLSQFVYAILYNVVMFGAAVAGLLLPYPKQSAWGLGFFVLGAAIGSGWGQLIYRLRNGMKLDSPPSHCPSCKTNISPWHNIPIVGWLLLRGKCAACEISIPVRYPLQELAFAVSFAGIGILLSRIN